MGECVNLATADLTTLASTYDLSVGAVDSVCNSIYRVDGCRCLKRNCSTNRWCSKYNGRCISASVKSPIGWKKWFSCSSRNQCHCYVPPCDQTKKCKEPSGIYPGGECSQFMITGSATTTKDCSGKCRCSRKWCEQTTPCAEVGGRCVGKKAPLTEGQVVFSAQCNEGCKCVGLNCAELGCDGTF